MSTLLQKYYQTDLFQKCYPYNTFGVIFGNLSKKSLQGYEDLNFIDFLLYLSFDWCNISMMALSIIHMAITLNGIYVNR